MTLTAESFAGRVLAVMSRRSPGFRRPVHHLPLSFTTDEVQPPRPAEESRLAALDAPQNAPDDREDFEAFYERTFARTYARTLLFAGGDKEVLEDAMQEAYISLFVQWDRIEATSREPWLNNILTRHVKRQVRRRREPDARLYDSPVASRNASPEETVEARAEANRALDAMNQLPELQRRILVLYTLQGMPIHEIAEHLNVERTKVLASLHKARRTLARSLSMEYDGK